MLYWNSVKVDGLPKRAGFYLALLNKEDYADGEEMAIIEVRVFQGNSYFMHCDRFTNKKIRITHWEGKLENGNYGYKENR